METDDEINDCDDDDGDVADDSHGILELVRSLSRKNEFYCVGERSVEKRV